MTVDAKLREDFIREAIWHGPLERAEAMLAAHPELRDADIHIAAILGDDTAVHACIARACWLASRGEIRGPFGGDALNYLGLSKYLRLDPARTAAFVAGRDSACSMPEPTPNTGFWTKGRVSGVRIGDVRGVGRGAQS